MAHNNNIAYTFVCTFLYKCNTPCGDHLGNFTLLVNKDCPVSMPNLPIQFGIHTDYPECAIGLVVTSQKFQIFSLSPRPLLYAHDAS